MYADRRDGAPNYTYGKGMAAALDFIGLSDKTEKEQAQNKKERIKKANENIIVANIEQQEISIIEFTFNSAGILLKK